MREAIEITNERSGDDTITFDSTVFNGGENSVIRLGSEGMLIVRDGLTIDASSATDVVITADTDNNDTLVPGTFVTDVFASLANDSTVLNDNALRVFAFTSRAELTLESLTITGGRLTTPTGRGGGIFSSTNGSITLSNSIVSGNSTTGIEGAGGGIYIESSGSLTLRDSTVSGNLTTGSRASGGGIGSSNYRDPRSEISLYNSTVSGNQSNATGGGIYNNGNLSLSGSVVTNNESGGDGGGIIGRFVTIDDSTISGNRSGDSGGGIFIRPTSSSAPDFGRVQISNSTVDGNQSESDGGGIFAARSDISLHNSTVSGNQSGRNGGGFGITYGAALVSSSTINDNQSGRDGGGIHLTNFVGDYYGPSRIRTLNSTISGNVAVDLGGGIYNGYRTTVEIVTSTITRNTAAGGGGLFSRSDPDLDPPLDRYNTRTEVSSSIVAGNSATTDMAGSDVATGEDATLTANPFVSQGFNLIGDGQQNGSELFLVSNTINDLVGTTSNPLDPVLGPLALNGGRNQTHALLPGSPALDAGNNDHAVDFSNVPLEYDQRGVGFDRIFAAALDIGAFESGRLVSSVTLSDDGELLIQGSDLDDISSVRLNDGAADQISVSFQTLVPGGGLINVISEDFLIADISSIRFLGFDGNDTFSSSGVMIPAVVFGQDGDDILEGGTGDDSLFGGQGDDSLFGGQGNDTLRVFAGVNEIFGGEGDDRLYGGGDGDELFGGIGDDFIRAGFGNDRIFGSDGDDTIEGSFGDDEIYGGNGDDTVIGGNGIDLLVGGAGINRLLGGEGDDLSLIHI